LRSRPSGELPTRQLAAGLALTLPVLLGAGPGRSLLLLLGVLSAAGLFLVWRRLRPRIHRAENAGADREVVGQPEKKEDATVDLLSQGPPGESIPGPGEWRDEGTGLPSARFLEHRFPTLSAEGRDSGARLTLLTIFVEGLPDVERSVGMDDGARALWEVAHTVRSVLRSGDTCVRAQGTALTAVLPGLDPDTSGHLVTRVRHAVDSLMLVTHAGREIRLGVTVGRAYMPRDGSDLPALLDAAQADLERNRLGEPPDADASAEKRLTRAVPVIPN
jgi:diguanylate cyclase (GGDEF)-like protein